MRTLSLLISLCLALTAVGQNITADLDAIFKQKYKSNEPGAVAVITKAGKPIYRVAVGMADLENNVALTPDHVFEIGSITKQFTAVSILMLVEQGKLSLTDPVTKFIADFPNGGSITIHHLLTHTSGIKSYTGMEKWRKLWRNDMTPAEMIDLFKNEPADFAPGEKYQYNNSAYFMLGYIIEQASGMTYPAFLQEKIFTPLGLKNTYFGSHSKIIRNRARGYQKNPDFINAEYLSLTQPYSAGSIMSNVDDLLVWQLAVQANKFVTNESIQKAFTNHKLNNGRPINYGYGWGLNEVAGTQSIEHSGGIFGYTTNAIYLPKEDVYVAIFSNCDCSSPVDVSIRMAAVAIGKPYTDAVARLKLDEAYAKSLTGSYAFDDGTSRVISFDGGELFSQRADGAGPKFKLLAQDKTHFVFDKDIVTMEFVIDKEVVKELKMRNRGIVTVGRK